MLRSQEKQGSSPKSMDESSEEISYYPQTSASLSSTCDDSLSTKHNVTEVSTDDTTFQSTSMSLTVSTVLTIKLINQIKTHHENPSPTRSEKTKSNHSLTSVNSCTTKVCSETCLTSMRGISPVYAKTYNTVNKSYISSRCSHSATETSESSYDRTYMCLNSPLSSSPSDHTSMTVKPCVSLINVDSFSYEITQLTSRMEKEAARQLVSASESCSLNPYVFFPIVEKRKVKETVCTWADGGHQEMMDVEENEQGEEDGSETSWESGDHDQDSDSSGTESHADAAESFEDVPESGSRELRSREPGSREVGSHELLSPELLSHQRMSHESHELWPHEPAPRELRPCELGSDEVGSRELLPHELLSSELVSHELLSQELWPQELWPQELEPHELEPRELDPRELQPRELEPRELEPHELEPHEQDTPRGNATYYELAAGELSTGGFGDTTLTSYHEAEVTPQRQPDQKTTCLNDCVRPTPHISEVTPEVIEKNYETNARAKFLHNIFKSHSSCHTKLASKDTKGENSGNEVKNTRLRQWKKHNQDDGNTTSELESSKKEIKSKNLDVFQLTEEHAKNESKTLRENARLKAQDYSRKLRLAISKARPTTKAGVRKKKSNADFSKQENISWRKPIEKENKTKNQTKSKKTGNRKSNSSCGGDVRKKKSRKKMKSRTECLQAKSGKQGGNNDTARCQTRASSKKNTSRGEKDRVVPYKTTNVKSKINPNYSLPLRSLSKKNRASNCTPKGNVNQKKFQKIKNKPLMKIAASRSNLSTRSCRYKQGADRRFTTGAKSRRDNNSCDRSCLFNSCSSLSSSRISRTYHRKLESQSSHNKRTSRSSLRKRVSDSSLGKRRSQSSVRKRKSRSALRKRGSDSSLPKRRSRSSLKRNRSDSNVRKRSSDISQRESRSPSSLRKLRSHSSVRKRRSHSSVIKSRSHSSVRKRRRHSSDTKRRSHSSVRKRSSDSYLKNCLSNTNQRRREHLKKTKSNKCLGLPPQVPRPSSGRAHSSKQPKVIVKPFGRQGRSATPLHQHHHRNTQPNHKIRAAWTEGHKLEIPTTPVRRKTPRFVGLNPGATKKKNKVVASSMQDIAGSKFSGRSFCNSSKKPSRYRLGRQLSTQEANIKTVKNSEKKTKENSKGISRRRRSTSPSSRKYHTQTSSNKETNSAGPSCSQKPRCKKKTTENPETQLTDPRVNTKFELAEPDRQGTTKFFQIIEEYTIQTSPPTVSTSMCIDASLGFQTTTVSTRKELRFSNDSPGGSENSILQIGVHSVTESVEYL